MPARSGEVFLALQAVKPVPGEKYVDIGSGDGRWVAVAGGVLGLDAMGYEHSPERHSIAEAAKQKLRENQTLTDDELARINLVQGDFFGADISDVDLFSLYPYGGPSLQAVEDKLMREGKEGARIVVYGSSVHYQPDAARLTLVSDAVPGTKTPVRIYKIDRTKS
jgi:hypothetical protein